MNALNRNAFMNAVSLYQMGLYVNEEGLTSTQINSRSKDHDRNKCDYFRYTNPKNKYSFMDREAPPKIALFLVLI